MTNDIIKETEERMKKCNELFKLQIKKIHTGRISPSILHNIKIEDFNEKNKKIFSPIQYLSNILTENTNTLIITVFNNKMVKKIEKAIIQSDLNLNINSTGNTIRVYFPPLTETRRQQLTKLVYIEAEKTKIAIRNIRRNINDKIKILIKNKTISEDKEYFLQNKIQSLTNSQIKIIDQFVKNKEIELKTF